MSDKIKLLSKRLKGYLIFIFLIISLINLNSQEIISERQSKPISFNTDFYRLVSFEEGGPLQFGISINNIIVDGVRIELDYYYKSKIELETHYQILDIDLTYERKIPFFKKQQLYFMGGYLIRNIYLSGLPGRNVTEGPPIIYSYQEESVYKMGIGASMCYGLNMNKNIFMESNFKFGYYILGKNSQFYGSRYSGFTDQDPKFFFALDILKFGYKFGDLPIKIDNKKMINSGFGISINPVYLLYPLIVSNSTSATKISFSLSYFSQKRSLEVEIPVYFKNYDRALSAIEEDDIMPGIRRTNHLGISIKKYFYGLESGTYLCGLVRYCHLEGLLEDNDPFDNNSIKHSEDKIAIGLGAGHRYFLNNRWYLDFYLQAGKYVFGNNDVFPDDNFKDYNDYSSFMEIGSMKIGYKFNL